MLNEVYKIYVGHKTGEAYKKATGLSYEFTYAQVHKVIKDLANKHEVSGYTLINAKFVYEGRGEKTTIIEIVRPADIGNEGVYSLVAELRKELHQDEILLTQHFMTAISFKEGE